MSAILALLTLPAAAQALPDGTGDDLPEDLDPVAEAKRLFESGERLYDEGHYEQAIAAFQAAYQLSDRPALLYNMANAYERLNRLSEAVDALEKFRGHASAEQREVVETRIQAIRARIAAQLDAAPAPLPVPVPVPRPVPVPVPVPVPHDRPSSAPWVLTGVGSAVALGGGIVAGTTWSSSRRYLELRDPAHYDALRPVNNASFGAAMAGGVAGGIGLVWALTRED